jgi:4'-phosphopantetheinyl transferase
MQLLWPTASTPPSLALEAAHVWAVSLDPQPQSEKPFFTVLCADERSRADEFRFEAGRRQFVVTRGALRMLLGQYLGERPQDVAFSVEAIGKPKLAAQHAATEVRFNVSHSGALALIAITHGCDVGVDVERNRTVKQLEQLARRYFHAQAIEGVLATPADKRNEAFLQYWTVKEAVLKAYGTGIAGCLDGFAVPLGESFGGWVDLSGLQKVDRPTECWVQRLSPLDDYSAAIALLGAKREVSCFTFPN